MQRELIEKAKSMLKSGEVVRVVGWRKGEFGYDPQPSVFTTEQDLEKNFVYDVFCAPNLSKYMVSLSRLEGKSLVFLKPCDSYSFTQLLKEHRIRRENVHIVGVPCEGNVDSYKLVALHDDITKATGDSSQVSLECLCGNFTVQTEQVLEERCYVCKGKKHITCDEVIGEEGEAKASGDRFSKVSELEAMTAEQRYEFWRGELSRCIRCNACRNACPACTCELCVFDNENSGAFNKAAANSFEESMFHVVRAFHVAGRCTDCGECSRVCPERIPLHLLNRKFIKDINDLYGEYQAGGDMDSVSPLTSYTKGDPEPSVVMTRGGQNE